MQDGPIDLDELGDLDDIDVVRDSSTDSVTIMLANKSRPDRFYSLLLSTDEAGILWEKLGQAVHVDE